MKSKTILFLSLLLPFFLFSQNKKDSTQWYQQILQSDTFSIDQKSVLLKNAINYSKQTKNDYATLDYQFRYGELLFNSGNYRGSVLILNKVVADLDVLMNDFVESGAEDVFTWNIPKKKNSRTKSKNLTKFSDTQSRKQWEDLHVESLANLGRSEVYLGIKDEAMLRFQKIMELYGADTNSIAVAKAYNGMGIVFGSRNNLNIAIEYFKKALDIYKKHNYLRGEYAEYSNIGGVYLSMGKFTEALNSFVEMHRIVLAEKYMGNELIYANLNLALAYEGLKKYDLAEKYYIEALYLAEQDKVYHLVLYIRSSYAKCLYAKGRYGQAKEQNELFLKEAKALDVVPMEMLGLRLQSQILEKEGNYKEANRLLNQSYVLFDSIYNSTSEERILTLKYQFDNYKLSQEQKFKEKNFELAEEKVANRNLWIAFLVVLSILAAIVIVVMTRRILHQCRVNNLMKERLAEAKEGEGIRLQGLNQHFKEQIDSKNKELTSNALLFLKFNELAIDLMDVVKTLKIHFTLKSKEKQLVNKMESLLKEFSPSKDWSEFKIYFEQVNSEFFPKLEAAYPDLTVNEMRLCALISLNLTAKEIASLTNRTFQSVGTAKFRLKKKMNLPPEANLYEVFLKL